MTRKLLIITLLLTILVCACSPPISGDAGTGYNPTPPANHDSEMAAHEARIATREAR